MVYKHPNQQSVDWYHRADDPRKSKTKHLFSNFIRFQNQMSFIYVPSRHYLSIMRTKIPEWSKSNVEVFDSGARSCIQYAIHKKNLYTYVWMTAVNKWQCFHFSWVKSVFCDHSYLWLENNFSHITRIDGRCHNDWQTDSFWTLVTSVITEHMKTLRQSNKTDFRREFFSFKLNFSTENHWPLLIKWIALLDLINRLKCD